ncbi:hypothetical protein CAOG_08360 [Capsaspora owczarzaki ATCC 30864]|uniref:hypothetical protein n=1 Tax=Capsaspora owczarzaki (strain ATCC 30864) TaxID=595528 RepID=UPI0001FE30A2|nr:hypothetical protein CAOG_08360 [Capsaspora owczarzaki ATCC 30864]|eukprot:XP_004340463.1 hypothetical protein CAOG_08360 [Capsaspora owczarzaki ATCC 30864]
MNPQPSSSSSQQQQQQDSDGVLNVLQSFRSKRRVDLPLRAITATLFVDGIACLIVDVTCFAFLWWRCGWQAAHAVLQSRLAETLLRSQSKASPSAAAARGGSLGASSSTAVTTPAAEKQRKVWVGRRVRIALRRF